jgi:hypothetical protein
VSKENELICRNRKFKKENSMKYIAIVSLLIFCFVVSGCVTASCGVHKHVWDKETGHFWICGAIYAPVRFKKNSVRLKDSQQIMIKAIMIEGEMPEVEATMLWERYKRSGIKGFLNYLIEVNPFFRQDRIYVSFVEKVKIRTKILKRTK